MEKFIIMIKLFYLLFNIYYLDLLMKLKFYLQISQSSNLYQNVPSQSLFTWLDWNLDEIPLLIPFFSDYWDYLLLYALYAKTILGCIS